MAMNVRAMVKRTVIAHERETNTGIGNPYSVSSRAVPSPVNTFYNNEYESGQR